MAPFGSGGETLPSEMPAQLVPTLGAAGIPGPLGVTPGLRLDGALRLPVNRGTPRTPAIPGPLGVMPGLRLDGAVPFALNWARPFTPVRPEGRAPWPDAAPA